MSEVEDVNGSFGVFFTNTLFTAWLPLSFAARFGFRLYFKVPLGLDDYFTVLTFVLNMAANAIEYKAIAAGFGRHIQFLTTKQQSHFIMWAQLSVLFDFLALWSIKVALCSFILTMIRGTYQDMRRMVYVFIVIICASTVAQTILWSLQARPLEKLWKPSIHGTVEDRHLIVIIFVTFSAINSFTDLFYALSPVYFLARIQISRSRKLRIVALTGCGLLVFAMSVLRIIFSRDFLDPDATWRLRRLYIVSITERNLAEIVADLPATYPLAQKLFSRVAPTNPFSLRTRLNSLMSQKSSRNQSFPTSSDSPNSGARQECVRPQFGPAFLNRGRSARQRQDSDEDIPLNEPVHLQYQATRSNNLKFITVRTQIEMEMERSGVGENGVFASVEGGAELPNEVLSDSGSHL